jgi:prepilin-type N-terminal cleavage/methylation domain-containing protein
MSGEETRAMREQRGFSLVELVIAMAVTLIVSSSIYGLLTVGSNAFRREPELADRQQNIRVALDIISRDAFMAGAGMPAFGQVFARNDPAGACGAALNGCGVMGTMGPVAAAARGGDNQQTDVLQILSADEQCPTVGICESGGPVPGTPGFFVTKLALPQCMRVPGLVMLTNDADFTVQSATASDTALACTNGPGAAPPNTRLTLTGPLPPFTPFNAFTSIPDSPSGAPAPNSVYAQRARVVRYRIAPSGDPIDNTPALWRTETGLFNADGTAAAEPGGGGFNPVNTPWEMIARGIEDLQVEYFDGNGAWTNQPPVSIPNDWNSLVRRVRISLSARVTQANLAGESQGGAAGPQRVRGELSTVVTPRAAYNELKMCVNAAVPCTPAQRIQ